MYAVRIRGLKVSQVESLQEAYEMMTGLLNDYSPQDLKVTIV